MSIQPALQKTGNADVPAIATDIREREKELPGRLCGSPNDERITYTAHSYPIKTIKLLLW